MQKTSQELMDTIHKITFDILCDIDDFCTERGITYYLAGGTCLGAVRHKGFIPWDHDADLMMPRKDYERFLAEFGAEYEGKYKVGSLPTEKKWVRTYSKVWDLNTKLFERKFSEIERGIAVDVFPIDGLPEGELGRKLYYQTTRVLTYLKKQMVRNEYRKTEKLIWVKKLLSKVFGIRGSRGIAIMLDNMAKKYDFETSKYVGVSMACHYWDKETIEREHMLSEIKMDFEGRRLPVINGYDQYLKNLYGNYMEIPKGTRERQEDIVDGWDIEVKKSN